MVKNVSDEISATEARKLGLEPCKICQPQDIYATPYNGKKKTQGKANTTQCLGRTKAGSRCKHMTSIGNGYCYQHQP
jgi:hypothetical protein